MSPRGTPARQLLAACLAYLGRMEEAHAEAERAMKEISRIRRLSRGIVFGSSVKSRKEGHDYFRIMTVYSGMLSFEQI